MKAISIIRKIATTLGAAVVGLLLSAATVAGAGPPLHHASGGGHFEASGSGGALIEFMFAFNAQQLNSYGGVRGQLEFHNLTSKNSLHMRIIRMDLLDSTTVGLIGEVTKSVGANAQIGDCRALKLQDNGEGKNSPLDQTSKLSNKCSGANLTAPEGWDDSNFALIPLDSGNIQIR